MITAALVILIIALLSCCYFMIHTIKRSESQKRLKKEFTIQFTSCMISAIIPSIISLCILHSEERSNKIQEAKERHAEIRRVSIDLISEIDPNCIVDVVNLYLRNETSIAREHISAKYDRLDNSLLTFNLCTEAYYTEGDDKRDAFINDCNSYAKSFSDALDIIQYLISVPDEGVYYVPSSLGAAMEESGLNRDILNLIFFPTDKLNRQQYGSFIEGVGTTVLSYLGHDNASTSIRKQMLLMVGHYLRSDMEDIMN